jgi:RimJ/RimL family protein N-acetyltransferase
MEIVYLRALDSTDVERTHQWHNDPELYKTLIGSFHFVSMPTEENWMRGKQSFSNQEFNLAICLSENSLHVGNIYIRNIDYISRRGAFHILIGERDQRGKGLGQAATRLAIQYVFQDLGLNRLELGVLEENKAAIHVYEKCGFIHEGKLRQYVFKEGIFKDILMMGICANDPPLWKSSQ